ncbi:hypothetical protein [Allorhodopirellula solitaria]|uniref:Uncharacterized protein n=1 Tax=Allorhodopirellula solitaria TaxID=2527987 RepID=A0A5C5XYN9_9BACT|nr:hypothetical protein [Allorhodopirellula solitaria]TWT67403.1 hypothetical protein CA85_22530 [Allorhodopirellula solitaria]
MFRFWSCYTLLTLAFSGTVTGEVTTYLGEADSPETGLLPSAEMEGSAKSQTVDSRVASRTAFVPKKASKSQANVGVDAALATTDTARSDEASSPASSKAGPIAGISLERSDRVMEGLDLSHTDVLMDPDHILVTGDEFKSSTSILTGDEFLDSQQIANPVFSLSDALILPMRESTKTDKPKTASASPEGEAGRINRRDIVDYSVDESMLASDSIYFDLSRAESSDLGFRSGPGSSDTSSNLVRDESLANPSSFGLLGASRRWISIAGFALIFTVTTAGAVFLISRAPILEFDDPLSYSVEGPGPTKLDRGSESRRHHSEHRQKTRRDTREHVQVVNQGAELLPSDQLETIEDAAYYLVSGLTEAERDLLRDAPDDMLCAGIRIGIRQNWQVCNPKSSVCVDAADNYSVYVADEVCDAIIETAQELISIKSSSDR